MNAEFSRAGKDDQTLKLPTSRHQSGTCRDPEHVLTLTLTWHGSPTPVARRSSPSAHLWWENALGMTMIARVKRGRASVIQP
jgi:hypothetical protein